MLATAEGGFGRRQAHPCVVGTELGFQAAGEALHLLLAVLPAE